MSPITPIQPPATRLWGAHMSTAGGIQNALTSGRDIGCTAVQLFSGNPRQWQHQPVTDEVVSKFQNALEETGIAFTVAHDSYLINLAAPDAFILERSRDAFRAELDRAEAFSIPWLVTHMGSRLASEEDAALDLLARSLALLLEQTESMQVGIALETTAGQGTTLGDRFEHIARVLEQNSHHPRLGVCMDTCHIFAAGYDIRTEETFNQTLSEFDRIIGLDRLRVLHVNDSKKGLGSRVDRHAHIGEGEIGIEAFRLLVNEPRLAHVPMILETPESDTMHQVNLDRLKSLVNDG